MRRALGRILLVVAAVLAHAWAMAALWIDGPASRAVAAVAVAAYLAGALVLARRAVPGSVGRGAAASLVVFVIVVGWWLSIAPSNERDWLPDVARLPSARIDGDALTLSNVRNFAYRTEDDYDERWEERRYDLSKLEGVDMFLVYWGPRRIAHTIVSWGFSDGQQLAVSIETRKERGEAYSAVLGFFRQFEVYYVVGDERDLVGLRAGPRGEQVFLYRLTTAPDVARAILLDYLGEINQLREQPVWYNALTHNCTTTIRYHAQHVAPANPFDWRILVNGYLDELGYERGQIDTSLPFDELRARSDVTEVAREALGVEDFSARIRRDLPQPRG